MLGMQKSGPTKLFLFCVFYPIVDCLVLDYGCLLLCACALDANQPKILLETMITRLYGHSQICSNPIPSLEKYCFMPSGKTLSILPKCISMYFPITKP
jgi:hypothetical protein